MFKRKVSRNSWFKESPSGKTVKITVYKEVWYLFGKIPLYVRTIKTEED